MQLTGPVEQDLVNEIDVLKHMLEFDNKTVLELGCGAADKTRQIAEQASVSTILRLKLIHTNTP